MKTVLAVVAILFFCGFAQTADWLQDSSKVKLTFKTPGTFGEINGSFSGLKSTIHFDENDLVSSSITVYVDPKTIETGISLRNKHLREEEKYLNTSRFAVASFTSKVIQKTTAGYQALGDMTIKGVTKPLGIPFSFTRNASGGVFKGQFRINALDYKIGTGNKLVAFDFEIPVITK